MEIDIPSSDGQQGGLDLSPEEQVKNYERSEHRSMVRSLLVAFLCFGGTMVFVPHFYSMEEMKAANDLLGNGNMLSSVEYFLQNGSAFLKVIFLIIGTFLMIHFVVTRGEKYRKTSRERYSYDTSVVEEQYRLGKVKKFKITRVLLLLFYLLSPVLLLTLIFSMMI